MKGKEAAPLNRRLMAGLIACLLLIVALAVAGGVAFSGVLWYREQLEELQNANQKTAEELQQRAEEAERKLKETEQQLADAAGDAARAQELQKELEQAKKDLEAARKDLAAAKQQLASKVTGAVYPAGTKLIALTFDDGPGGKTTPRLLDELKKRNIKATFFVVGTNAAKHPEILKRMDAEGHVIGNHSYAHQNLTKGAAAAMQDQVNKCAAIIRGAVGYDPVLLRPPGGNYDNRLLGYAKEKGVSVVNWTVDTRDWEHRNKDTILATAFRQGKYGVHDGAIVLMHDVYETSVDAAVEMMDRRTAQGYTMVTVPELIRVKGGGLQAGRFYYSGDHFKDKA